MHDDTISNGVDKPFSKGDSVPEEAEYVCVPCGFKHHYKTGDTFGECMSCLSGSPGGQHEEFVAGEEMWEKMSPVISQDHAA